MVFGGDPFVFLSGKAKKAGVIGWPVSHSKSPQLHGYWIRSLKLDAAYLPLAIAPDHLDEALRGLLYAGFEGLNVTVPHKEAVMKCCDEIDAFAQKIGAVNTLCFQGGKILGSNSDAFGFVENLYQNGLESLEGVRAGILGAGGAAKAVALGLQAAGVASLTIANRTEKKASDLVNTLNSLVPTRPLKNVTFQEREQEERHPDKTRSDFWALFIPWDQKEDLFGDCDLLVNTTSLGMAGRPPLSLSLDALPSHAVVTDIVYTPLITPILQRALDRKLKVIDGLDMLLHQARPGFEKWFGCRPWVDQDLRRFVLNS